MKSLTQFTFSSYWTIAFSFFTFLSASLLAQESFRNASELDNPEPLAGYTDIQSSQEIYLFWAQDNFFKNQMVDYFPTPQPEASLLAGSITDVFASSQIQSGAEENATTRSAVAAADFNNDGIDEIIKATTTIDLDILLSITAVGSELEITGNTTTQQIEANVSTQSRLNLKLLAGNFDADVAEELVLIWAEQMESPTLRLMIFDIQSGTPLVLTSFTYDQPILQYDVVLADLDLNGQQEIVVTTLEKSSSNPFARTQVLALESDEIVVKALTDITQFSGNEVFSNDVSLALTQGDYDGDIAPEIAIVFRKPYADLTGHLIQLHLFQAVDIIDNATESVFEELHLVNQATLQDTFLEFVSSYQEIYAASGDLRGIGNDDLTIYTPTREMLLHIPLDTLKEIRTTITRLVGGSNDDPIFCFTRGGSQTLAIQIADLNRDGFEELVYVEAEGCTEDIISDNLAGARLAIDIYDLSGEGAVLTGSLNSNASNTQYYGVLAANFVLGDFNGDNYRLGQGRYFRKSELSQPLIILNAPPIHFDQFSGQSFDINNCYDGQDCNFTSTYFRSTSMSAQTSTTVSSAWSIGATVEGEVSADFEVVKSSVKASVSAKYGEKFSNYKKSGERLEISTQVSAVEDDQIYATVTDYDIWEYPIYEQDSIVAHLISVTPTVLERRWFPSKSYNAFDYLPDHEVGNILSYRERKPALSNIAQNISADEFTLSDNSLNKWTVNQRSFTESGSSFEQEIELEASVTVESEAEFKIFGGSLSATVEGTYEASELSTHKTRISEEIEIEVELGGVDESLGEVKYAVQPYCYWAKNGALVVDYTVQPEVPAPGASDTWWSANYGQKADPALILPWRYDPEKGFTLQDEQVKRFQSKSIAFSDARPDPGDTITIFVEVHNWSLLPTKNPVEVGLYLCDPTEESNRMTNIDGVEIISTEGPLEPRGSEIVSIRWAVPEDLPTFPRIYARLDPDNKENEIHEANNFGFNLLNLSTNQAPCPVPNIVSNQRFMPADSKHISLFPNPAQDEMTIAIKNQHAGAMQINVFNFLGQHICQYDQRVSSSGDQVYKMDVGDLEPGPYACQILLDGRIYAKSFVKSR